MADLGKWLHLSRKAGSLLMGEEAVRNALLKGRARLVLMAADAGGATVRWVQRETSRLGVNLANTGLEKETLGVMLGRNTVAVMAVTNADLARAIVGELAHHIEP